MTLLASSITAPVGGEVPDTFMVLSNGVYQCGEYLSATWGGQMATVEWVLGYISGLNAASTGAMRMTGASALQQPEAVHSWLLNYCQSHALAPIVDAAGQLRIEAAGREGRLPPSGGSKPLP
jgi:hypothetical protein